MSESNDADKPEVLNTSCKIAFFSIINNWRKCSFKDGNHDLKKLLLKEIFHDYVSADFIKATYQSKK